MLISVSDGVETRREAFFGSARGPALENIQKHEETEPGGLKTCKNTRKRAQEVRKHAKSRENGPQGTTRIHTYTQTHIHTAIYCLGAFEVGVYFRA